MITNRSIGTYGRLGNMLWQIAAVIGIARRSGQDYGFGPVMNLDHRDRFGSDEDIDIDKYLVNPLPKLGHVYLQERHIGWGYEDVYLPAGDWDLRGHFQSEKYFKDSIDEVRHYMTFINEPEGCNKVAIHYRAGDYQDGGKDVYHPRQSIEYYRAAMSHFGQHTKYIVFSDDIDAAKKLLQGINAEYVSGNYIDDLKLMKSCHSFICANSSYSMMAAILANQPGKKIIAPSLWFGEPAGGLKMDYPENCIVI